MTHETGPAHIDRLIRLLMMLPTPQSPPYRMFWDQVAQEHHVDLHYVQRNIAGPLHQILLGPGRTQAVPRANLARYGLYFFADPSDDLVAAIASHVHPGFPGTVAGRLWVQQLRTAAFEVLVENPSEEQVDQACTDWIRTIKTAHR
ncbi:hypothetical protein SAMN05421803_101712 [Nocardiopsis flavescens]|uniref:Uncharacterized protein n=1 Tax=Nocardiopsis flavescens TaxID=758803 RepID=A0A1M6CHU1_9ACTN|nr:hypothetical protein [Nocardiopsis flavescens]SHI60595.1 hypothetical protein SAMN05421803_101712 [Nocardiopsis flavescens]